MVLGGSAAYRRGAQMEKLEKTLMLHKRLLQFRLAIVHKIRYEAGAGVETGYGV